MVASDHEHLDASFLASANRIRSLVARRVHDGTNAAEDEALQFQVVLRKFLVGGRFELLLGEANDATAFLTELVVGGLHLGND